MSKAATMIMLVIAAAVAVPLIWMLTMNGTMMGGMMGGGFCPM